MSLQLGKAELLLCMAPCSSEQVTAPERCLGTLVLLRVHLCLSSRSARWRYDPEPPEVALAVGVRRTRS